MSKLVRKTFIQFGSTVNAASEIGQFGSFASPVYTTDIATLQAGTAWPRGWAAETIATNRPFLEDFNAIDYVYSYMLFYILEMGLAEWDAGTTYYTNSRVQYSGVEYVSLQDTNLNQTPGGAGSAYWQASGDVKGADIASASSITLGSDGTIFKVTGTTTINTINNPNSIPVVQLIFGGILTVTSSGNIILNNGNFLTAANSTLTLIWNGSSWVEAARSPLTVTNLALLASILDYGTSTTTGTTRAQNILRVAYGKVNSVGGQSSAVITGLPFASSASYVCIVSTASNPQFGIFTAFAVNNSGSQFTIYSNGNNTVDMVWMCIGT